MRRRLGGYRIERLGLCVLAALVGGAVVFSECRSTRGPGSSSVAPAMFQELTLYDVEGLGGSDVSEEALALIPRCTVSTKQAGVMFGQTQWKRGGRLTPVWKGSWLGVVTMNNGARCRIAMSYYGGFFKILGEDGYYQTLGQSRQEVEAVLDKALVDVFIPARRSRNNEIEGHGTN